MDASASGTTDIVSATLPTSRGEGGDGCAPCAGRWRPAPEPEEGAAPQRLELEVPAAKWSSAPA